MNEEDKHHCYECNKQFPDRSSLKTHVKKIHTYKDKWKCHICGYTTNYKDKLARHSKTHSNVSRSAKKYSCPLCDTFQSHDRAVMKYHYTNAHDVSIQIRNIEFLNKNDFIAWKGEMEKEEVCKFIADGGARKTNSTIYQDFKCFRDGFYVCRGKGLRHLKIKGSNKIDGICPASIKMSQDERTNIIRVKYCNTHVGHVAERGRLKLIKLEKKEMAGKIPLCAVLDGIRNDSKSELVDFLSRNDLFYEDSVKNSNDCTSIENWIERMQQEADMIRFHKAQGSITLTHPELSEDDFVLVIANDAQLNMLKNHGSDFICFDSTHGTNQHGYELTTLLVLDDLKRGFPVAFMISSRTDAQIVSIFTSSLKLSLDCVIEASVLMSDMRDIFYKGWCNVMPLPQHWLYCSWHMDRACRESLNQISNVEKRISIYKTVRTLLEETDEGIFPLILARSIKAMKDDSETRNFGKYFEEKYSINYTSWAFVHWKYCRNNSNMHLENIHKVLKQIYHQGKKLNRLDKALYALMCFTGDNVYDQMVKTAEKLSPNVLNVKQRHEKSLNMKDCKITTSNDGWSLSYPSEQEISNLVRLDTGACCCTLKCDECNVCIHSFKCSCLDSTVKWNICKHIHRLCSFLRECRETISQSVVHDNTLGVLNILAEECQLPTVVLQELTHPKQPNVNINDEKLNILQEFLFALNNAHSLTDLYALRKAVRETISTNEASHSEISNKYSDIPTENLVNSTGNDCGQKKFS